MISKTVESFLIEHKLTDKNIVVAFSGGYDSMCLLHVLKKLSAKYNYKLIAIHLNHNWRGKESELEEQNCKNFCSDIIFYSEELSDDVPHTETFAREARYNFFEKCAIKFNSQVIFTAHNANDNAETVFYRLLKGTGIVGLQGIPQVRDIYYRPLLTIYRDEIEKYCNKYKLKPNFDSSNNNSKYIRNKIRNEIFPQIKKSFPEFEKKLNTLTISAQQINKIINKNIKDLCKYSTKEFIAFDIEIQKNIILNFLRNNKFDYDKKRIDDIYEFIINSADSKSGKTLSLHTNKWLFVNNKKIEIISKQEKSYKEINILDCGVFNLGEKVFTIEKCKTIPNKYPDDNEFIAYISTDKINFTLRNRKDGDIIYPLGLNGKQKLKKYLTSKQIPKHEKDNLLLLTSGNEVLWVAGIGLSEKLKVTNKPTHILKIRKGAYNE